MQTATPFFPSCSEVNSVGYLEFDEPISARSTLSTVLVYTNEGCTGGSLVQFTNRKNKDHGYKK